ncbi:MAG: prolyl oligopeptidase family serine peptidase [Saprospiraceae bacterium]
MRIIFIFTLVYLTAFSAFAQVDIINLLSVPFPSNLIGSGDGNTITWVFNDKGERNIFIAKAPDFEAKNLTSFVGDEGLEISNLQLSKNGSHLVFVRGNAPNSKGEPANPAQLMTSADRMIWIADLVTDSLQKIGNGTSPAFSPDGSKLIYLNKGEVWQSPVGKKPETVKLFFLRGGVQSLRWSPDGSKIAFVANRGDHSFIGYFDIKSNKVMYVDPSIDVDSEPAWSPDGLSLAFIRSPFEKDKLLFAPKRQGHPWSIRIHNIETGETKEIWKAQPGQGSVLYGELPVNANKLIWAKSNQLVFPWEQNGWQQLYALDINTKKVKHLSPGEGEVENAEISPDLSMLYYTTNIGDIDRRHIWKYDFNTNLSTQITTENIEWSPVHTSQGLAYLYSTSTKPAWPAIMKNNGMTEDLAKKSFPQSFPKSGLVIPTAIKITATDGMKVPAQLFVPATKKEGDKRPAVIFLHGGSRRQMLLGFNYGQYYSHAYALNQYFASKGYIVISLNFRSGIGYGLNFREAENYGATGASEFYDVLGTGLYLKSREDVDPDKITLWGGSYGGYLTAMALSRASDLFACGVDIHGVHDWNEGIRNFVPSYVPEKMPDFKALAFRSSPEHSVDGWKSPVLFIHGDDDRNVNFTETVRMAELLRKKNVYFEQLVLPDEVHSFLLHKNWLKAYEATFEFMERMLKKK